MRFIGLDLAWSIANPSGYCVVEGDRVVASGLAHGDDDIVDRLAPAVAGACLVAIDAPLIVPNQTGRRVCEARIAALGVFHAAAHPSNLGLAAFAGGARGRRLAERLGLSMDPLIEAGTAVRTAIEVYPHPATIALFGLDVVLKYKARRNRPLDVRRGEYRRLCAHLESLAAADPPLRVATGDRWPQLLAAVESASGRPLKDAEDELDAHLCAYIAAYYWTHGATRCRVIGDLGLGYIVTPVDGRMAAALDAAAGIDSAIRKS